MALGDPPCGDPSPGWDHRVESWHAPARDALCRAGLVRVLGSRRSFMAAARGLHAAGPHWLVGDRFAGSGAVGEATRAIGWRHLHCGIDPAVARRATARTAATLPRGVASLEPNTKDGDDA